MDVRLVHSVLEQACFEINILNQQQAMKTIQDFEKLPENFYIECLIRIIQTSDTLRAEIRLLAVISLKNIVRMRWMVRGGSVAPVAPDGKQFVRDFLREYLLEREKKVAIQLGVLMAQVARYDWPSSWPELFPALVASIQREADWLRQRRAMYSIELILKELAVMKLVGAKKATSDLSMQLFPIISSAWIQMSGTVGENMASVFSSTTVEHIQSFEEMLNHLCVTTKVLQILLIKGYNEICRSTDLPAFYEHYVRCTAMFSAFLRQAKAQRAATGAQAEEPNALDDSNSEQEEYTATSGGTDAAKVTISLLRRVVKTSATTLMEVQKVHPVQIGPFLGPLLDFFFNQIFEEYGCSPSAAHLAPMELPCHEGYCIPAILFLSNTVACSSYYAEGEGSYGGSSVSSLASRLMGGDAGSGAAAAAAHGVRMAFFSPERVAHLLAFSLHRLLRMGPAQLEEWSDEPEGYIVTQEGYTERDSIKCAAEGLISGLFDLAPAVMMTQLGDLLRDSTRQQAVVQTLPPPRDEVVFWDAVYLCAGVGVATLSPHLNGTEWLAGTLGPMLTALLAHPSAGALSGGQQILRCRIVWLMSCWVSEFDGVALAQLLPLLVQLLEPGSGSDVVTCLYAANALRNIMQSHNFRFEMLEPVVLRAVEALCGVSMTRLRESESQTSILLVIGDIFVSMGRRPLDTVLGPLGAHLGQLWAHSDATSPLKSTLLETFTQMVKAGGSSASCLHGIVLPLIAYATCASQESAHLVKQGVELWLAVARNLSVATASTGAVMSLYPPALNEIFQRNMPLLYESGLVGAEVEDLRDAMLVAEAHAITGRGNFLSTCAGPLQKIFLKTLGQVAPRGVIYIIRPIEALLLACPAEMSSFLLESEILHVMLLACAVKIPRLGLDLSEFEEAEVVLVLYLSIVARLMLVAPAVLTEAVSRFVLRLAAERGIDPSTIQGAPTIVMDGLLRLMFDNFDSVGYCTSGMWRRRLWSLALLSLYPTTNPTHLQWFAEVVSIAADVVTEEVADEGRSRAQHLIIAALSVDEPAPAWDLEDDDAAAGGGAVPEEPIATAFGHLLRSDVVTTLSVLNLTRERLAMLQGVVSEEDFRLLVEATGEATIQLFVQG